MSFQKPRGIRLERKKEASLINWNLKRPYPPEKVRMVIPEGSVPCVNVGSQVQVGQKIAAPELKTPKGVTVHASLAGTLEKIGTFPDALGRESLSVEICRPHEPKNIIPAWDVWKEWEQLSAAEMLQSFPQYGLVTTDPSMEPVHAKIQRHEKIQTVIIHACEPEPYITCEQILVMSHPLEVLKGAELLKKVTGADKIIMAIEACNFEMIELIKSKIFFLKWDFIEIQQVPAFYPQGSETLLLRQWPEDQRDKTIVFPASTAFAVYEAVVHRKPFYERVLTVGGECVVEPRSLWLPLGISFEDAIRTCKGVMREPQKVLMGGPMSGVAQTSLSVSVMAGTNAILALPKEVVKEKPEEPCIRCNRCVDACPVSISPAMITLAAERQEFQLAEIWGASLCMECGNCGYVCPAKRPMIELIRLARKQPTSRLPSEKVKG